MNVPNNKNKNNKLVYYCQRLVQWPAFWMIILSICLLYTLISKQVFWTGVDTYFHMNSIYEDAMQIKTGHFSYFISLFSFERSGRIVNSLYGPILNYLLGTLLLICHSWIRFEFVLAFVTLMVSGLGMYYCARTIKLDRPLATILGLFYMISRPVLVMWVGNSEFTGLGAAVLLPWVVMIGAEIFERRQIRIIPLAVMMAICLQIHLVTSLIAVGVLIPLVFCSFVLSHKKWLMFRNGALATLIAICLSGNVFGALYEVFSTNHLIPTFPNFNLQTTSGNKAISIQGHTITDLGHLYTIMIAVIILLMIVRWRSIKLLDGCLLFDDLFFLWLSSAYFPWNDLLRFCPRLASTVQFPARFTTVIFLLTLLLLGRMVAVSSTFRWRWAINLALVVIFIFNLWPTLSWTAWKTHVWQSPAVVSYWPSHTKYGGFRYSRTSDQIRRAIRSRNLGRAINIVHKVTLDYLPTQPRLNMKNYYRLPTNQIYIRDFHHQGRFHKFAKNHGLSMRWQSQNNDKIIVPLVKYCNTVVILNHRRVNPKNSLVGTMKVRPRQGQNQLDISYRSGHVFKLMSIVSILSWLIVICRWILLKRFNRIK